MYRILYEKRIYKDLDKIPDTDVKRILNVFRELTDEPFSAKSKKLSGKKELYRVRQGDYRVIYTINHREKEIKIILVSHRKESYRRL